MKIIPNIKIIVLEQWIHTVNTDELVITWEFYDKQQQTIVYNRFTGNYLRKYSTDFNKDDVNSLVLKNLKDIKYIRCQKQ